MVIGKNVVFDIEAGSEIEAKLKDLNTMKFASTTGEVSAVPLLTQEALKDLIKGFPKWPVVIKTETPKFDSNVLLNGAQIGKSFMVQSIAAQALGSVFLTSMEMDYSNLEKKVLSSFTIAKPRPKASDSQYFQNHKEYLAKVEEEAEDPVQEYDPEDPGRGGEYWSSDEEAFLTGCFKLGDDPDTLARKHQRSTGAICTRLVLLKFLTFNNKAAGTFHKNYSKFYRVDTLELWADLGKKKP